MMKKPKRQLTKTHQTDKGKYTGRLSNDAKSGKHESFRLSEDFFRQVIESLEDYAVFTTDINGKVSSWNKGAERLLGYGEKEVIGQSVDIFFIPEDRVKKAAQKELKMAAKTKHSVNERYHVRKDGTLFWGSGLVFPLQDEHGNLRGFTKVMRDRTEHKRNVEALDRWKHIFQHAGWGSAVVDPRTNTFIEVNKQFAKMHGYPRVEEMIGMKLADTFAPESKAELPKHIDHVHKEGHYTYESLHIRKDGTIFPVLTEVTAFKDTKGKVVFRAATFQDITERKDAEERLRQDEEQFRLIINGVQDYAIFTLDPKGRISKWNSGSEKIKGYTADEIIGKHFSIFYPPEEKEQGKPDKLLAIAKKQGQVQDEGWRVRKDGSRIWVHVSLTAIKDNQGKLLGFSKITHDITERKTYEESLRESQERFMLAQQAANIGTFEWTIDTNEFLCTEQLEVIYGLRPGTMGGTLEDWIKLVHPEDQERVKDMLQAAIAGKRIDTEFRIIQPRGDERWIAMRAKVFYDEQGRPERLLGANRNVTKRKAAEESLRESEKRFHQLADSMPQIVWTAGPDGLIDYYNRQWYNFTGFKPGSVDGDWKEIIHPDDVEGTLKTWHNSVKTGRPFQREFRFRGLKQEVYRWFLGRALPIKDEQGNIVKWFGTCTDIDDVKHTLTRKKELEELAQALTEQHRQLVALNETKDEFISLASHQLRTPATGVKQYIGMLLEGYMGPMAKDQEDMLRYAYESNERQLKIIDDLLKVAHVDAGKVTLLKTSCNLTPLIRSVLSEQYSTFRKRRQKVTFNKPHRPVVAFVDAHLLRMVLENIIDNASKYTPEGKSVKISLTHNTDYVTLAVKDEGIGIAKKDQKKLFQKFSRVDNPLSTLVGGTGLGLYWAKKIIDLHGGVIEVASRLGEGSTFTIKIPAPVN